MTRDLLLTINAGSSSIKYAAFLPDASARAFTGQLDRIGTPSATLTTSAAPNHTQRVTANTDADGATIVAGQVRDHLRDGTLLAIAHRVVHGGAKLTQHALITPAVMDQLRRTEPIDMAHLPREIGLIDAFATAFPDVPQVACFDTAFHRDMPPISKMLPIPRKYADAGVHRYGFHGLSYTYLLSRLGELAGPDAASRRVILAHLGAGASMAAVQRGKPIDTTMAFTPTSGLMMATRPGDLDPGLLVYLLRSQKLCADDLDDLITHRCGLQGVSQTSADMRDLLNARATDPRAADAIDLFCHIARKHLGALVATLGGIDTLVFSGGIGERSAEIRVGICNGLSFMGISLDPQANSANADVVSPPSSPTTVRVIPTDEEVIMARIARTLI
jgi:acetate kinase